MVTVLQIEENIHRKSLEYWIFIRIWLTHPRPKCENTTSQRQATNTRKILFRLSRTDWNSVNLNFTVVHSDPHDRTRPDPTQFMNGPDPYPTLELHWGAICGMTETKGPRFRSPRLFIHPSSMPRNLHKKTQRTLLCHAIRTSPPLACYVWYSDGEHCRRRSLLAVSITTYPSRVGVPNATSPFSDPPAPSSLKG